MITIELSDSEEEVSSDQTISPSQLPELAEEEDPDEEPPEPDESEELPDDDVPVLTEAAQSPLEQAPPATQKSRQQQLNRNLSTERFREAACKVKLSIRVLKTMQFHTTRTVARAIDPAHSTPGPTRKKRTERQQEDLGPFPAVLQMICRAIRKSEQCHLVVQLVSPSSELLQYFVMIRHVNEDGGKEEMFLGVEAEISEGKPISLALCLGFPILCSTTVQLNDGDGSFFMSDSRRCVVLKPENIHSQWAAIQFLNSSMQNASEEGYFEMGRSHHWCEYYSRLIAENYGRKGGVPHWTVTSARSTARKSILEVFGGKGPPRRGSTTPLEISKSKKLQNQTSMDELTKLIVQKIRDVMYKVDLDTASTKSIRLQVEREIGMDLEHRKEFIEERVLVTLGQMDEPSLIKDYLYLGNEWNACNYEELIDNGVTHILNVTSDIDAPFESVFKYHRISVLDIPSENIMCHWEDTHRFIRDCRDIGGKVLVHCQKGISRSGSTTIAYLMRQYGLSLDSAQSFVVERRSIVNPNPGFAKQLEFYDQTLREGVVDVEERMGSTTLSEIY